MKEALFQGVATALVTPFQDGKVNLTMLQRLLSMQLHAGIHTFVICGTTGEAPTLSDDEKYFLYEKSKEWIGPEGLILAGTGSNSTEHAVSLSKAAEDLGADGLLVVTPYYNKCTPKGLIQHYTAIAEAVKIPIILYNVPSRTGVDIPVSVYQELSQIDNIVGVKEASPDLKKIAEIRLSCPEEFSIYSGNDDLLLPILSLGGKGVISVASNVKPREMREITDRFREGDVPGAQEAFYKLLPLMKALFSEVNPIPVKQAMEMVGLPCGDCRLPLTKIEPTNLEKIKKLL